MLNYFMAGFTHYSHIFHFLGGVLEEGDPSPHTKEGGEGRRVKNKSYTESDGLMLVLNEFGKYVLYIFPHVKL